MPNCFILLATLPSLPGSSIFTSGLLLKPPGVPSCLTASFAPWVRASLRPPVASFCERSLSDSASALAEIIKPAHRPAKRRVGRSMAASLFKKETLANGVDADFQWLRIAAIQLYGVVFGGDEHQFAADFDARADGVAMAGFDLGRIVTQMKRQRHLAFDRTFLFVEDHGRCRSGEHTAELQPQSNNRYPPSL